MAFRFSVAGLRLGLMALLGLILGAESAVAGTGACGARFIAPTASSYLAAEVDDGTLISSLNATGPAAGWAAASLPVTLPAMGSITSPWTICGLTDANNAVVFSAPLLAPPTTPVLSQITGSVLGARTNYVKITYVNVAGETVGSVESSLAIDANHLLVVASPGSFGNATAWNVYVGTGTNNETKQNPSPLALNTNWTEPTGGLITGTTVPAVGAAPSAYILDGGQSLLTYVVGTGNYQTATLEADGYNYRVISTSQESRRINGATSTYPNRWVYPGGPGYQATQGDNGNSISSALASGPLSVTLPSVNTISEGWMVALAADATNPVKLAVNVTNGGLIILNGTGAPVTTYTLLAGNYQTIQFDGANFRFITGNGSAIQDLSGLMTIRADNAVNPVALQNLTNQSITYTTGPPGPPTQFTVGDYSSGLNGRPILRVGGHNSNSIVGETINDFAAHTAIFPSGVTGFGEIAPGSTGNEAFALYGQCNQYDAGVCSVLELDSFNYAGTADTSLPPTRNINSSAIVPVPLTLVAKGDFESSVAIQVSGVLGAAKGFNTAIYMNPGAALLNGIYIDSTSLVGASGVGIMVKIPGGGQNLVLQTAGAITPTNLVLNIEDAFGNTRSSISQSGTVTGTRFVVTPVPPVATLVTDQAQAAGGSTLLAFASVTGTVVGQVVQGTNIPLGNQIASIVATAQTTRAANGAFLTGQKVIPMADTTSFAVGQQCTDTTAAAIGAGNVIASIQAATSITLTSNTIAGSGGAADNITCDPVVTLYQPTTAAIGVGASVNFIANLIAPSTQSPVFIQGGVTTTGNSFMTGPSVLGQNTNTPLVLLRKVTTPASTFLNFSQDIGNGPIAYAQLAMNSATVTPGAENGNFLLNTMKAGVSTEDFRVVGATGHFLIGTVADCGSLLCVSGDARSATHTLTAAAPTVAAGQIGLGSTVSAASNCGSLSGAVGCIDVNVAGTARHVPYY